MRIGIIGLGIVGGTIKYGFEKLGHKVLVHDIKLETKIEGVLTAELIFICVPTPSNEDGSCDTRIVEDVIAQLAMLKYGGVIVIKSTVVPGTTEAMIQKYGIRGPNDVGKRPYIAFVPEMLRERCAVADFTENHDVCVVGSDSDYAYTLIKRAHGKYPKNFARLTPTEAELSKYFNNVYNATLITFANSFYEVCKHLDADYTAIKDAMVKRDHIVDQYLDANDNFRGFSGYCLPKDTRALNHLAKSLKTDVNFFRALLDENAKYKATVLPGMRPE